MKPILFDIPIPGFLQNILGESLLFPAYYVMLSLSFMIAIVLIVRGARRLKIDINAALDVTLVGIIGVLLVMRLFFVFQKWDQFLVPFTWEKFIAIFKIWEGGLVMYGGVIGALLFGCTWCWVKRINMANMMDAIAPSIGTGLFFTRLGCFLNGCCHGKATSCLLGVSFPKDSILYRYHLGRGLVNQDSLASARVHPTQLYESFSGLIIFIILILYFKRRKIEGSVFYLFGILYSIERFSVEFLRGDSVRGFGTFLGITLSTSQWISIIFLLLCVLGWIFHPRSFDFSKYPAQHPPAEATPAA